MNPIDKAVWYVETHLGDAISLEDVARHSGVSAFHLTRAFAATTGRPLMRYARARRLSEAARRLANGGGEAILTIALEAGYGSHEAFTRAFRAQFGVAPERLREASRLSDLDLVEPLLLEAEPMAKLDPPRFETTKPMRLAGITARYACENAGGIPEQWRRLNAYTGEIPNEVGEAAYGACFNFDDDGGYDYIAGVEVSDFSDLPDGFSVLRVPEQRYAVFARKDHISTIRQAWSAIWADWFPKSGLETADAPTFEKYGPEFDPQTGAGGFELWVPIKG